MENIVSISGLNKWYGTFHVLKDIDLAVKPKERIVIAGPSGSGKSTLIRHLVASLDDNREYAVVDGAGLTTTTLLESTLREFGYEAEFGSDSELLGMLRVFAMHQASKYQAPLLVIENTHNMAGGRVLPRAGMQQLFDLARRHDLAVHVDGARVLNAAVASGCSPGELVAGTDSGQPAARTALRPILNACSPTWETQPVTTSSTIDGSRSLRSCSALRTWAPRSVGCQSLSLPLRRPAGVRTTSTMTASCMRSLSFIRFGPRPKTFSEGWGSGGWRRHWCRAVRGGSPTVGVPLD